MKTQTGFTFLTTLIGLPIFLGILLLGSVPALAATITVNNVSDNTTQDDKCTFREALDNAQGAKHADCVLGTTGGEDEIVFNLATPATINLTGVLPVISDNVNIINHTGQKLTIRRDTGGDYRIFKINSGVTVTIEGLTIENGLANASDNRGGGVYNAGTLTLKNSTIQRNQANYGGGIANTGTLILTQSTVSNNSILPVGGYLSGAGLFNKGGKITITNSTVSGNWTPATVWAGGAGLYNGSSGTVEIINSTISKNAVLSVSSVGGGLVNNSGVVTVKNTIIAANSANSASATTFAAIYSPDVYGNITGNNYNLIGDLSGNTGTLGTGTDIVSSSPLLGTLQDNGGLVETHALLSGSPAIDAGDSQLAVAADLTTDQRCSSRFWETVDIGAYEVITQQPIYGYDFGAANFTVPEGNDTHIVPNVVVIKRYGEDLSQASSVDVILTASTATTAIPVQFDPCQDSQMVPIEIQGNTTPEEDKKLALSFANFSSGGLNGRIQSTATLTITNDDTTPPVDDTTPPVDDTTPPVDDTTPPVDDTTPPVDDTTPPVDGTTPPVRPPPLPPVVLPPVVLPPPTQPTPPPPPAGYSSMPAPSGIVLFNNTLIGATSTQSLLINNTGGTPLIIHNLTGISGTNKYDFQVLSPNFPLIIYPGDPEQTVTLQCNPRLGTGLRTATLELSSNDPKYPTISYSLQCTGMKAGYSSRPKAGSILKFGSSEIGQALKFEITIENNGNANLEVNLEALSGANASDFQVLSPPLPITIPAGGVAPTVTVQCSPTTAGLRKATLKLRSNDSNSPTPTYWLECNGLLPPPPLPVTQQPPVETVNETVNKDSGTGTSPSGNVECSTDCPAKSPPVTVTTPTPPVAPPLPKPEPIPTLTVTIEGYGKVTLNGSDCGTGCTNNYPTGTVVTLLATPDENWQFDGWQGDCDNQGTVTMNSNHACTATFSPLPNFMLTTIIDGNGGRLISTPAGIDCGTVCTASYPSQTVVTLQAIPNEGWQFGGWSEGCDANGNITLTSDSLCVAKFVPANYTLSIQVATGNLLGGSGKVSTSDGQECDNASCSYRYPNGTAVTLTALPNLGSQFAGWGDVANDCDSQGKVLMNRDHTCIATFSPILVMLTTTTKGKGTVTTYPLGIGPYSQSFLWGKIVNLTAQPEAKWLFKEWRGDCHGNNVSNNIVMNNDSSCTAVFVAEDSDRDGIPDTEEANAPNNGDGNHDGIPDKDQNHVASFKDPRHGDSYITLEVNPACNLNQVYTKAKDAKKTGKIFSAVEFELDSCLTTDVTLSYYGENNSLKTAINEYGPIVSNFLLGHGWSNLPGVLPSTEYINGQEVTKLKTSFKKDDNSEKQKETSAANTEDGYITFWRPPFYVDEDRGAVMITVGRQGNPQGEVCVEYGAMDGTAKLCQDYRFSPEDCDPQKPNQQKKRQICWQENETGTLGGKDIWIEILNNRIKDEPDKEFTFSLGKSSRKDISVRDSLAKVIIRNDDFSPCATEIKDGFSAKCDAKGQIVTEELTISAGSILQNVVFEKKVTIGPGSRVDNGTFNGEVTVEGGTRIMNPTVFKGKVDNGGSIEAASPVEFQGPVTNQGGISNAQFQQDVVNHRGSIANATVNLNVTLTGGMLSGKIDNQGTLVDVRLYSGNVEGGELKGIIEGNEVSTVKDVVLTSSTYGDTTLVGVQLKGTIQGEEGSNVWLKNVQVLPGTHLINVIIGEKVTLAEDVTLENIRLAANVHLTSGTLQGSISGEDEKASAWLENVQIVADTHLKNVTLGKNVKMAPGITLVGLVINAGDSVLQAVHLAADAVLQGGQVQGTIQGDSDDSAAELTKVKVLAGSLLQNVKIGKGVTLAKDVTLDNVMLTAEVSSLRKVKLTGNITGDIKYPVRLEEVEVAPASHLKNVVIGENVQLAKGVTLENVEVSVPLQEITLQGKITGKAGVILQNVRLSTSVSLQNVKLQGDIIGESEDGSPVWLTAGEILAGSYLENVILGEDVKLPEAVKWGKQVFRCQGAMGTTAEGQPVKTRACFLGQLSTDSSSQPNSVMLTQEDVEKVKVSITMLIAPDDVGKAAGLFIVADYNITLGKGGLWGYTTKDLKDWFPFEENNLSQLPAVNSYAQLPERVELVIYEGPLSNLPGEFTVTAGYRLTSDGTLIYNGGNPIHFMVGNSASIDLKPESRSITSNAAKKTSYFVPWVENETGQAGNHLTFTNADTLKVLTKVRIDARDVGKPADILMVAVSRYNVESATYTRAGEKWQRWDGKLASLQSAQSIKELPEILEIPVYQGRLKDMLGDFIVYVGYRLEKGVIVFNGRAPIHFMLMDQE